MSLTRTLMKALVAIAVFCTASSSDAHQSETTIYKMNLNDGHIAKLQSGQSLDSTIPKNDRGDVTAILLGTVDNKDQEFAVVEDQVEIVGESAVISLSESLMDQMKEQPLRMLVDKVAFSKVLVNYDAAVSVEALQEEAADEAPEVPRLPSAAAEAKKMFYINLRNGKTMEGEIDDFDSFKIKTGFGEVTLPMDQIAGIRFHTDPNESSVVILKNGDALTGTPIVDAVKIKTEWGHADIGPEYMNSITTSANSIFSQGQTDFGTRWQLRTSIPVQSGTSPRQQFNSNTRVFSNQ